MDNKLTNDPDAKLPVELNFSNIDDFDPGRVAEQIPALKKLLEMRLNLTQMLSKMEGNDKLEAMLSEILASTDKSKALASELGIDPAAQPEGEQS